MKCDPPASKERGRSPLRRVQPGNQESGTAEKPAHQSQDRLFWTRRTQHVGHGEDKEEHRDGEDKGVGHGGEVVGLWIRDRDLVDNRNHTGQPEQAREEIADDEHGNKEQRAEPDEGGQLRHNEDVGEQADDRSLPNGLAQHAGLQLLCAGNDHRKGPRHPEPARMPRRVDVDPDEEADGKAGCGEEGPQQVVRVHHRQHETLGARPEGCRRLHARSQ